MGERSENVGKGRIKKFPYPQTPGIMIWNGIYLGVNFWTTWILNSEEHSDLNPHNLSYD